MQSLAHRAILVLVCIACVMVASCAADPATRPPMVSQAPAALTATQVAEKFDLAGASASGLHVEARTFENGRASLTAKSWMSRDSVRTEISDAGRLVYVLSVRGERAQESIPAGCVADATQGPRFEDYTVADPCWIGSPRLVSVSWGCHVGDLFGTWLSPDRRMYATLTPRLSASTLLGVAEVDGARCAVIRWEMEPQGAQEAGRFRQGATYYIDLATGWLRRTEQYQAEGNRRVERVSLYRIEVVDPAAVVFELRRE